MMLSILPGHGASAEAEPQRNRHTPVVHRLAIPEPIIPV
jgi:hypothetical protein